MILKPEELRAALDNQPVTDAFDFSVDESLVVTFTHKETCKKLIVRNFRILNDIQAYHGEESMISALEHTALQVERQLQDLCNLLQKGEIK